MAICPQCGHERKESDDHFISSGECPRCGIIYRKWTPPAVSDPKLPDSKGEILNPVPERARKRFSAFVWIGLMLIVVLVLVKWFLSQDAKSIRSGLSVVARIESTLPVTEPVGMESMSYLIRNGEHDMDTLAAGQIFTPPARTPVLFRAGFLFTRNPMAGGDVDVKLRMVLSEWLGDRPGPDALWISDPLVISGSDTDVPAQWLDCDVPHVTLNPGKQYIAWVTLSNLDNLSEACIGIPGMGPRYSSPSNNLTIHHSGLSPYPEGRRALYRRQLPPDEDASIAPDPAWEVHGYGQNLHFRMSFENRAR